MACAELGGVDWEWGKLLMMPWSGHSWGDLIGRNPTDRGKRSVESSERLGCTGHVGAGRLGSYGYTRSSMLAPPAVP